MKYFLLIALIALLGVLGMPKQGFAQSQTDLSEIATVVNGVTQHFFNKDMVAFDRLWADDAVFITVTGIKASGRDAIVDMHSMADHVVDPSTEIVLEEPIIRFLDNDTAISYSVWGGLVFSFGLNKLPVQSGYLTAVLRRTDAEWKIVSATNALNPERGEPFEITTYTPDLWRQWGVPRPDGLPLDGSPNK